jgi:NAD+ kinase
MDRGSSEMKKIGIISKPRKQEAGAIILGLCSWMEKRGIEPLLDGETAALVGKTSPYKKEEIPEKVEMILVLGGDGTLISVARLVGEAGPPILGVNLGSLGFLTEITLDEIYPTLERILSGDYRVEERTMLETSLLRENREAARHLVLNDVVINKGALARMIQMETTVNGVYLNSFRADGLIISSPTGSTAYSLSAGGPIVSPAVKAIIISPICPHTLTLRPIVLPDDVTVEVTLLTENEDAMVTLDGQVGQPLRYRDVIVIRKARGSIRLILSPDKDYYQVLRQKLWWGERTVK